MICNDYIVFTSLEYDVVDELELFFLQPTTNITVPLIKTGIAWPSDKEIKFRNPDGNLQEGNTIY